MVVMINDMIRGGNNRFLGVLEGVDREQLLVNVIYEPAYSNIELGITEDDTSLAPSSFCIRLLMTRPGSEPGPEGICLPSMAIPGEGARLGVIVPPIPESSLGHNAIGQFIIVTIQITYSLLYYTNKNCDPHLQYVFQTKCW